MCRALGVSASGCHAWRTRGDSPRAKANHALLGTVRAIHAESGGACGAPRVHAVPRSHGRRVGRHRIARLMRGAVLRGLAAIPRRVRTTDSRHDHPIAPNRLRRNFTATAPNQVWLADLTYIRTGEGRLFLAALIDMFTRKSSGPCLARNSPPGCFVRASPDRSASAGWAVREPLHADIALEALAMAVERQRPTPGLIHHSDRGSQGDLNRSSQHPAEGGCDGDEEEALGQVGARQATLARPPRCGAARSSGGVPGGDRDRRVQRGRGVRGRRVAGGRRPMVPEGRRHGADASGGFGAACDRSMPVLRRARGDRAGTCHGTGRARDREAAGPGGFDDLAGDPAQCRDAQRRPGLQGEHRAMARRPLRPAAQDREAGDERGPPRLRRGSPRRQDLGAGRPPVGRARDVMEGPSSWPSPAAEMGAGMEPRADLARTAARLSRGPADARLARGHLPGALRPVPRGPASGADRLPANRPRAAGSPVAPRRSRHVLRLAGDHDRRAAGRGGGPGRPRPLGGGSDHRPSPVGDRDARRTLHPLHAAAAPAADGRTRRSAAGRRPARRPPAMARRRSGTPSRAPSSRCRASSAGR